MSRPVYKYEVEGNTLRRVSEDAEGMHLDFNADSISALRSHLNIPADELHRVKAEEDAALAEGRVLVAEDAGAVATPPAAEAEAPAPVAEAPVEVGVEHEGRRQRRNRREG